MIPYAAIVLAGGSARRLGGADKPGLAVGGAPMLGRVLAAVPDAYPRIVVGPARPDLPTDVLVTREDPPGAGPVAALAAGLRLVGQVCDTVAVLAADLPFLTPAAVEALLTRSAGADGALFADGTGRRQLLCGAWRRTALEQRLQALGTLEGASMRALFDTLTVAEIRSPHVIGNGSGPPPWFDCDTDEDLRQAREIQG